MNDGIEGKAISPAPTEISDVDTWVPGGHPLGPHPQVVLSLVYRLASGRRMGPAITVHNNILYLWKMKHKDYFEGDLSFQISIQWKHFGINFKEYSDEHDDVR